MPRLLLFAACERIILADDNTVSLISLLEKMEMTAHVAPGEPPPAGDAMSPFSWNALATWTREDGDQDGVFFRQRVQLVMPDGSTPIQLESPLLFSEGRQLSRGMFKIQGFPFMRDGGIAVVKLLLRPVDSETEWQEMAAWPIQLEFRTVERRSETA